MLPPVSWSFLRSRWDTYHNPAVAAAVVAAVIAVVAVAVVAAVVAAAVVEGQQQQSVRSD